MFDSPPPSHYEIQAPMPSVKLKSYEVEQVLYTYYNMPQKVVMMVMDKLAPLVENPEHHPILDAFIARSKEIRLWWCSCKKSPPLLETDATFKAPKNHEVLLDLAQLRILWEVIAPQEKLKAHRHQWANLMLVVSGAQLEIEQESGKKETKIWNTGFYDLPAETASQSYKNLSQTPFKALRIEIKD